jgi:hypothetical protein
MRYMPLHGSGREIIQFRENAVDDQFVENLTVHLGDVQRKARA